VTIIPLPFMLDVTKYLLSYHPNPNGSRFQEGVSPFRPPTPFFIIDIEHLIPGGQNALPRKKPIGRCRPYLVEGKNIQSAGRIPYLFIKPRKVFLDEFRYREVVGTA
jgi:hypothetical protein